MRLKLLYYNKTKLYTSDRHILYQAYHDALGSLFFFCYIFCLFIIYSIYLLFFIFFFFSSRRRHTRSLRDWSSDVCSSDLLCLVAKAESRRTDAAVDDKAKGLGKSALPGKAVGRAQGEREEKKGGQGGQRSEERRVGKEGRARWWP